MRETLLQRTECVPGQRRSSRPRGRQSGLRPGYWVADTTAFWDIRHAIMMRIGDELRRIGVEVSLPTTTLNLGDRLPDRRR